MSEDCSHDRISIDQRSGVGLFPRTLLAVCLDCGVRGFISVVDGDTKGDFDRAEHGEQVWTKREEPQG